jgi:predicted AlkP superfamily phosphohydrolase/phosphomutase
VRNLSDFGTKTTSTMFNDRIVLLLESWCLFMGRFVRLLLALLVAAVSVAEEEAPARVILFSWDGAPYWITSRLLADGRLPNLGRLVEEGAWSDGMITSFPTETAAGHAMLWTGHHGHTNGVTGDALLGEPASEYSRLESRSGYLSDVLKAEPIWVRTARAGLMTYTLHATQSYPFEKHIRLAGPNHLRMLQGYTGISMPAEVLDETNVIAEPAEGWAIPEAWAEPSRQFQFGTTEERYWGLFFDDPVDPTVGCDTLGLVKDKQDEAFIARIKSGTDGRFSAPFQVSRQGEDLWFSLRLYELAPACDTFLIYRSSAEAVVASSEDFPGLGEPSIEAFAGNGGFGAYTGGRLGMPVRAGEAEKRLIDTLAHVTEQLQRQAEQVLNRRDYRLLIMYTPVPGEVTHVYGGYVDPNVSGYQEDVAQRLWPILTRAYQLQDDLLGIVMRYAERDGAHVLLLSDHGMAGTNRRLHVNVALERAGLLSLTRDRQIDLSRTQALMLPQADASVAVNTTDRKGGIVPLERKPSVLAEVKRALDLVVDPETGKRLVTGFFESSRSGLVQPGGETTGDLFLDLAPGYTFSGATDEDVLVTAIRPQGSHLFLPTRRDMLAIFGAWGPRVPSGARWPRVRGIDVVPSILDILGLDVPAELPGKSLIPRKAIIDSHQSSVVSGR